MPPALAATRERKPGALRRAFVDAVHFDRVAVAPLSGLRVGIGVAAMLIAGTVLGDVAAAVSMASGAILVGTASLGGGARPPLVKMLLATGVMTVVTFVGSVSGQISWLHFALLAPTCLAAGLVGSLGSTATVVGNQAIIAFVVYGRFAEPGPVALKLAVYVIVGGLTQIALSVGFHWPMALKAQREALAQGFDALADLAASGAAGHPTTGLTAGAVLDEAQLALTSPILFGHDDVAALLGLLETGRRIRVELVVLGARTRDVTVALSAPGSTPPSPGRSPVGPGSARIPPGASRDLLVAAESALHGAQASLLAVAAALRRGGTVPTDAVERAVPRVAAAARHPSVTPGVSGLAKPLADRTAALSGQLRAARGLLADAATPGHRWTRVAVGHQPARVQSSLTAAVETLRANFNLDSTAARHALRLTVVVMLGEWLADHTALQRGYWVALTAALVLRPDFTATFTRGFARVLGTLVGVGVAGAVVSLSGADHTTAVVLVSLLIAAGAATFQASYAVYTAFITGAIVLLLSFLGGSAWSTAGDRLIDTLIGGAIALLAYTVWPSWSERDARQALAQLVAAQRAYLAAVLGGAACGWTPDRFQEGAASALARRTRLARVNAQGAVGRSLSEPAAHRFAGGPALLATMQRIGVSAHALRSDRSDRATLSPDASPPPGAGEVVEAATQALASGIDVALRTIGRALADGTPADTGLPPLRHLHDDLQTALAGSGVGRPVLLGETDEMVDAIDTLGQLVGVPG